MAGVTLDRLYLHTAADLSDYLAVYLDDLSESPEGPAEAREYANGRVRLITRPGIKSNVQIRLDLVSAADVQQLRTRAKTLLMLRDPFGRKLWGFYSAFSASQALNGLCDVSLTFTEITASEEV